MVLIKSSKIDHGVEPNDMIEIGKDNWERGRLACIKNHIVDLNDMVGVTT